ncbi:MAG TPA: homocysteine S-methyltransferase family protein, partial [candidate division Zixibacteria bacterium]|nr:homocysteine S-methyltransferase family protein [candidate division Zixibacteria bacterium]
DGAISTELFHRGCPLDGCPEKFALEHPNIIEQIHADYIRAGAHVITTATFGANVARLAEHRVTESAGTVSQLLASLAVRVADGRAHVAGSIGPGCLDESLEDQIRGLINAGADFLLFETMTSLEAAVAAVKSSHPISNLPIIVSFAFNQNLMTSDGATIEQVVSRLEAEKIEMIGVNCMTRSEDLVSAIGRIKAVSSLPVLARPNVGIPKMDNGMLLYPLDRSGFVSVLSDCINAGAAAVGGCCGTTPEYIHEAKKRLAS